MRARGRGGVRNTRTVIQRIGSRKAATCRTVNHKSFELIDEDIIDVHTVICLVVGDFEHRVGVVASQGSFLKIIGIGAFSMVT